jgi:membrane protease YdiL (CAAX protease family)
VVAAVVVLAITGFGGRHLRPAGFDGHGWELLLLVPSLVFLAWAEEWLVHGYLFERVRGGAGAPRAVLVTAMAFAIFHVSGPGGGFVAAINGLLFGIGLGLLRLLTGGIETGVGFRVGWTVVLGLVLGGRVEGYPLPALLRAGTESLDPRLGGGEYGPEASVVATVAFLVLVGLLLRPLLPSRQEP